MYYYYILDIDYNVSPNDITVSGLSAGGAFAIQLHVAYSHTIVGVASYAGSKSNIV